MKTMAYFMGDQEFQPVCRIVPLRCQVSWTKPLNEEQHKKNYDLIVNSLVLSNMIVINIQKEMTGLRIYFHHHLTTIFTRQLPWLADTSKVFNLSNSTDSKSIGNPLASNWRQLM